VFQVRGHDTGAHAGDAVPVRHGRRHVIMSKYADHLPPYRQAEIYARDGT
jgi:hypothetical protein